jgi:hypothetical protein
MDAKVGKLNKPKQTSLLDESSVALHCLDVSSARLCSLIVLPTLHSSIFQCQTKIKPVGLVPLAHSAIPFMLGSAKCVQQLAIQRFQATWPWILLQV